MAISYIMKSLGSDRETAHALAKKARRIINPNWGFIEQLEHFEKQVLNPDDKSKHISHPDVISKIQKSFPLNAVAVKKCRWKDMSCTYIEGSSLTELIGDMTDIGKYVLQKYVWSTLSNFW